MLGSTCVGGVCIGLGLPNVGSSLAKAAASALLSQVASAMSSAANWLVGHVFALINDTTRPDLGASWFEAQLSTMERLAELVVLPVLMAASLGAVLRQDLKRLGRIWGVGLPVSLLAGIAAAQLAGVASTATDAMCEVILGPHGQIVATDLSKMLVDSSLSGAPPFVQIAIDGLLVLGAVAVWMELVVRAAGIYVAVFFMPLVLVGYIWPATMHGAKKIVEIFVALLLSKFVIVATIALSLSALQNESGADNVVSGAAIFMIAAFTPFALMRLAPIVETASIAHLEGMSRKPVRAAASMVALPSHPAIRQVMSSMGPSGSSAQQTTTAVGPQELPVRKPDFPIAPSAGGAGDG